MPKIVTLKDNNDDIVYPITPIDAVFTDTSVTLENMIDAKADTDLTNVVNGSVTTNKINDGAVTSDKIAWPTVKAKTTNGTFIGRSPGSGDNWKRVGRISYSRREQGLCTHIDFIIGFGNNGNTTQIARIELSGQLAWSGSSGGRAGWNYIFYPYNTGKTLSNIEIKVISMDSENLEYDVWIRSNFAYTAVTAYFSPIMDANDNVYATFIPETNTGNWTTTAPTGNVCNILGQTMYSNYYKATVTGTPDANGFFEVPRTVVKPSTGFIIGARSTVSDAFYFPFSHITASGGERYTLRALRHEFSPKTGEQTVDIFYVLYP